MRITVVCMDDIMRDHVKWRFRTEGPIPNLVGIVDKGDEVYHKKFILSIDKILKMKNL